MLRELIKSSLRQWGYDLVQYVDVPSHPFNVLDLVLAREVERHGPFTVLQIGANDGVGSDPVHSAIREFELPALLVEPLPDLFSRLQANYAGLPDIRFEQCAIAERDGTAMMYRIRPEADLPAWCQGLASFDRGHLSSTKFGVKNLEQHVEAVEVPTLTIRSLLNKQRIESVGMLQVDTEGYDCKIVAAALECGLRPAIIHYEFVHCSPRARASCKRLLRENGYSFIDVGRDTLAVLQAASPTDLQCDAAAPSLAE